MLVKRPYETKQPRLPIVAQPGHMASYNFVNVGSGNWVLPGNGLLHQALTWTNVD